MNGITNVFDHRLGFSGLTGIDAAPPLLQAAAKIRIARAAKRQSHGRR